MKTHRSAIALSFTIGVVAASCLAILNYTLIAIAGMDWHTAANSSVAASIGALLVFLTFMIVDALA